MEMKLRQSILNLHTQDRYSYAYCSAKFLFISATMADLQVPKVFYQEVQKSLNSFSPFQGQPSVSATSCA